MPEFHARAWTADWVNAWLASIGTVLICDGLRVRWMASNPPHAVFESDVSNVPATVVAALPDAEEISGYALTREGGDGSELSQKVDVEAYGTRAASARGIGDFTFSSAFTDLAPLDSGRLEASPFNPPAPKGITLWQRFHACLMAVVESEDPETLVAQSMTVGGVRVKQNGLGFDYRRIPLPTDPWGDPWVDPLVEALAFFGLSLLPMRGDGRFPCVRGWRSEAGRAGIRKSEEGAFRWPAWGEPFTASAVDAHLDRFWSGNRIPPPLAVFSAVPFSPKGSSDMTRGFASRRIG